MSNELDQFERMIRDSVEGFEVPYDAGSWANMEQSLDSLGKGSGISSFTKIAASIAGATILAGGIYYFSSDSNTTEQPTLNAQEITFKSDTHAQPFAETPSTHSTEASSPTSTSSTAIAVHPSTQSSTNHHNASPHVAIEENGGIVTHANEPQEGQTLVVEHQAGNPPLTPAAPQQSPEEANATILPGNFNIVMSDIEGCQGMTVKFSIDQAEIEGDYMWNFGDGQSSSQPSTVHTYTQPGEYEVVLTINNGKDFIVKPAEETVFVYPSPDVNFSYSISEQNVEPLTNFVNHTDQAMTYQWDFGQGQFSTEKNPDIRFTKMGPYAVTLEATNEYNCVGKVTKPIVIDRKYNLYAPTGFTPNGDDKNQTWLPVALEVLDVNFTLSIFDKNGKLVYETMDKNQPWDGRDLTGQINEGVYVWVLVIKDPDGDIPEQGYVTIAR